MPDRRPRLVVMVKEPVAGRAKTRLGREIGMTRAAWWARHQLRRLVRRLADPRWDLTLAVAPDRALLSRALPGGTARCTQGAGDLGDRMTRLFRQLPPGPVVIVGSDVPAITPAHIARAFAALGEAQAVIGPARDGGYWLIGLARIRRPGRDLLAGVRWSTKFAQVDTLAALSDYRIRFVDTLSDVDSAADLRRHAAQFRVVRRGGA
jgi:rSAM/selenodomain-associated transferase 1